MVSSRDKEEDQSRVHMNDRNDPLGPRIGDCKIILIESLDLRGDET